MSKKGGDSVWLLEIIIVAKITWSIDGIQLWSAVLKSSKYGFKLNCLTVHDSRGVFAVCLQFLVLGISTKPPLRYLNHSAKPPPVLASRVGCLMRKECECACDGRWFDFLIAFSEYCRVRIKRDALCRNLVIELLNTIMSITSSWLHHCTAAAQIKVKEDHFCCWVDRATAATSTSRQLNSKWNYLCCVRCYIFYVRCDDSKNVLDHIPKLADKRWPGGLNGHLGYFSVQQGSNSKMWSQKVHKSEEKSYVQINLTQSFNIKSNYPKKLTGNAVKYGLRKRELNCVNFTTLALWSSNWGSFRVISRNLN